MLLPVNCFLSVIRERGSSLGSGHSLGTLTQRGPDHGTHSLHHLPLQSPTVDKAVPVDTQGSHRHPGPQTAGPSPSVSGGGSKQCTEVDTKPSAARRALRTKQQKPSVAAKGCSPIARHSTAAQADTRHAWGAHQISRTYGACHVGRAPGKVPQSRHEWVGQSNCHWQIPAPVK